MSHFHNIGELAELWEFGDEQTLYDRVISRGRLKAAFHYSGFVQPSGAANTTEPFLINGPVYIHERSTPNESFPHVWSITAVAATPGTSSEQKIYPDYDGTSKWLILEEPCLVESNELLISQEDAESFAEANDLPVPGNGKSTDSPMTTREKDNLLRLVAVLAQMFIKSNPGVRLGTPENPNVSQLADSIKLHIELNELSDEGLKPRTLHDKLSEAFKSLR